MWLIPERLKIYLCREPTDLRRGFDMLAAMAEHLFACAATSGHLFVFINRRGDRMKILYWDLGGYCLWYKRLEAGHFRLPPGGPTAELSPAELAMVLEGIEAREVRRGRRYQLPQT